MTDLAPFLNPFTGDSGDGGSVGLVPAPAAGDTAAGKFLSAGGHWAIPPGGEGGGVTTVGTFDSQTGAANGLVIAGVNLYAQSATATRPGMINNTNQTFSGSKKFNNQIQVSTSNNFLSLGTTNPTTYTSAVTTSSRTFTTPDADSNSVRPLGSATANNWVQYISANGVQNLAQPAFTNISGTLNLSSQVSSILPGANGGTGVANTGLTISLASGASGKVLVSDNLGNASWGILSGVSVASITGTANQILANGTVGTPTTGAVTLTLPQSIGTASTPQFAQLAIGTAVTSAYGLHVYMASSPSIYISQLINGTLTQTSTGDASGQQVSLLNQTIFSPADGAVKCVANYIAPTFSAPSGKVIAASTGIEIYPFYNTNVGTLTVTYGLLISEGSSGTGTVFNSYGLYVKTPVAASLINICASFEGSVQFQSVATGSTTASLGVSNCPAISGTAPFKWFKFYDDAGNLVYMPGWK